VKADITRMEKTPPASTTSKVAQYVRMSTQHQQYSPENQSDIIHRYAATHNMEIVQTYSDHGRSGLNIAGRDGLSQLVDDVEKGQVDVSALLVYDVSRWGRFQDVDVECPAAFVPESMRQTGMRGAIYGARKEAHSRADREPASAD
jgi:predicted site-specific integrase-resolvase